MFRLWGKEFKDNHMIKDTTICDDSDETRTHKIFNAFLESLVAIPVNPCYYNSNNYCYYLWKGGSLWPL